MEDHKLIFLEGKDAIKPINNSYEKMIFNLEGIDNNLLNDHNKLLLSLEEMIFTNNIHTFTDKNDNLTIEEEKTGDVYTVQLASDGNTTYNIDELINEIETQLNNFSSLTYTVTFDNTKYFIDISTSENIKLLSNTQNCYNELGLTVTGNFVNSITSDKAVNISGINYIDVTCELNNNNIHTKRVSNVIARIPVYGSFGSIIHYSDKSVNHFTINKDLRRLELGLLDDRGNALQLDSNTSISFVFKLQYKY